MFEKIYYDLVDTRVPSIDRATRTFTVEYYVEFYRAWYKRASTDGVAFFNYPIPMKQSFQFEWYPTLKYKIRLMKHLVSVTITSNSIEKL